MALHADIATKCYRFQKDNNGTNPYGGKWYERLKQINRIRKSCKEFYNKQQQQNKSNANTSSTSSNVMSHLQTNDNMSNFQQTPTQMNATANNTANMNKSETIENQLDFTDFI
jgi:hypothetical protein